MSEKLLEVKNLKKYFPVPSGTLHAVDDVTFDLNKGETLGIVGESGCGKSTLGKTILRLTNPTSGQVLYGGRDIAAIPDKDFVKLRPELQMIFQDPMTSLNPRMSVKEQIEEPLLIYKKYPVTPTAPSARRRSWSSWTPSVWPAATPRCTPTSWTAAAVSVSASPAASPWSRSSSSATSRSARWTC